MDAGPLGQALLQAFGGRITSATPSTPNGDVLTWTSATKTWAPGSLGAGSFPLLAPSGSVSAPSYSFSAAPTAGMFYASGTFLVSGSGVGLFVGANAALTDVAPGTTLLWAQDAYAQAVTNTAGGATIVGGGIGQRFYTILIAANLSGATFTIAVNGGTAVVLTDGTSFTHSGVEATEATNLGAAITADGTLGPQVTVSVVGAVIYLQPKATCYQLSISTNAAGGDATATQGTNGTITLGSQLTWPKGLSFALATPNILGPNDGALFIVAGTNAGSNGLAARVSGGPAAASSNAAGGADNIIAGAGDGSGAGGAVNCTGGTAGATGAGGAINVTSGAGGATSGDAGAINILSGVPIDGNGGLITINGRNAATVTAANRGGGGVTITAGGSQGTTQGGTITLTAGKGDQAAAGTNATGGAINITCGQGAGSSNGGAGTLSTGAGGSGAGSGNGGALTLQTGNGGATSGASGAITIQSGSVADGNGGALQFTGRNAATTTAANRTGGSLTFTAGGSTGTSAGGSFVFNSGVGDLPVAGTNATGGGFAIHCGTGAGTQAGGACNINSSATDGQGGATGAGGAVNIQAGKGGATSGAGGAVSIAGGAGAGSTSGAGGLSTLKGGAGSTGSNNNAAGGVLIDSGASSGTGNGTILLKLPASTASGASANSSSTVLTLSDAGFVYLALQNVTTVGAVSLTAAQGGSTSGAGGGASLIAGAAGTAGGNTGAVTITGGANAIASGSTNGGAVTITGGASSGTTSTGNGGAVTETGGLGGTTSGTGGAWTGKGGAGQGSTSGVGGLATIQGGAGSTGSNNNAAGGCTIDTGASSGTGIGTITLKCAPAGGSGSGANASANQIVLTAAACTITPATTITGALTLTAKTTTYNNVAAVGWGIPAIYGSGNITAQSSNATICSYANPAADGTFLVSATMNVTVVTAISTSLVVTYTDAGNVAQTLILPVQLSGGTGGTYLTNGLIVAGAADDYSTPVHQIRVKASTTITIKTAVGTFTGVTYSASGTISQVA